MLAFEKYLETKEISLDSVMETTPETAEIVMIIDRSGSMQTGRADFEGGINSFIEEQKKVEGQARITLVQFDNTIDVVYHGDLKDCPNYSLVPRGGTALNDAVGQTINFVGELLRKTDKDKRPKLISVITTTDGGENGSREFTTQVVQDMIKEQTDKYNWNFIFLGADYDAISNSGYASSAGTAANFSKGNAQTFYKGTSDKFGVARGLAAQGVDVASLAKSMEYTDQERKDFDKGAK